MASLLKDQAYEILLDKIWNGEFQPNEVYSLTKIAQETGISRTPLRDALQKLSDEKHVDILQSRGFRLHQLNEIEIKQRYHLTIAVEGYSLIRLIEKYKKNTKDKHVTALEQCVYRMDHHPDQLTFKEMYQLDNQFHNVLIDSLDDGFADYLSLREHGFVNIPELHIYARCLDMEKMFSFNRETLDAIKSLDGNRAYQNMIANADYVYQVYMTEYTKENSAADSYSF